MSAEHLTGLSYRVCPAFIGNLEKELCHTENLGEQELVVTFRRS